MSLWKMFTAGAGALLSVACSTTPPQGVTPISGFNAERYLGSWYEIARLDHRFERGLDHVTATYSKRDDGGLKVVNRGFNTRKQRWQESIGKAYFTGPADQAALKVSFFGPFYGGYNVIALDSNYQHALVCGPNRDYLWILSRTPQLDAGIKAELLAKARSAGFAVDQLIWVNQQ
ncbi:lipocalin family protein [Erwinia sorbitola]|uniref:Outer membrane lipoprotein Blc n=1 Tax=Erwinia sorbitola TaxID=2681984 RepID=A0A6I6ELZ0_9GAMM|nr:lipocalin family protein [Erwinia sorbitola]QGU89155.1 outer membrane lipoprotein Blc [Erwinia sorbitola]